MDDVWLDQQGSEIPGDTWRLLSSQLTDKRRQRMEEVAARRTEFVRLVVQDIHDPHNVAACMRSAEAFGVLNLDVVTLYQKFKPSQACRGTAEWLKVNRWDTIPDCVKELRRSGYKIAAGYPDPEAMPLFEVPCHEPVAILFGNEHRGIDPAWLDEVDYKFTIPVVGMVESLNISVAAALSMLEITRRSQQAVGDDLYFLSPERQEALLGQWLTRHVKSYKQQLIELRRREKSSPME